MIARTSERVAPLTMRSTGPAAHALVFVHRRRGGPVNLVSLRARSPTSNIVLRPTVVSVSSLSAGLLRRSVAHQRLFAELPVSRLARRAPRPAAHRRHRAERRRAFSLRSTFTRCVASVPLALASFPRRWRMITCCRCADSSRRFHAARGTPRFAFPALALPSFAASSATVRAHRLGAVQSVLRGYDSSPNHAFNRTRRHML